jgi:hypothetical protein
MGVPDPTRVKSSFSSLVSIVAPLPVCGVFTKMALYQHLWHEVQSSGNPLS